MIYLCNDNVGCDFVSGTMLLTVNAIRCAANIGSCSSDFICNAVCSTDFPGGRGFCNIVGKGGSRSCNCNYDCPPTGSSSKLCIDGSGICNNS